MQELSYTYYQSPIGLIQIAGTDTYITQVHFVDNEDDYMPPTNLTPILTECLEQLIQFFNGNRREFDLPIHQTGTDFQHKVWSQLAAIPFGKTITYMDVAKRLGDPKSIRAAASSNGKNQVAVIVPCHRVVGSNQKLVGYAGGLWRKKWLLDHENKIAHGVQTLF